MTSKRKRRHHGTAHPPAAPPPLFTPAVLTELASGITAGIDQLAARIAAVIRGLRVGQTAACIADETHIKQSTIEKIAEAYWASPDAAARLAAHSGRLTADDRRQRRYNMAQQVARGDRPSVVAARFRVTVPTVRKACHEFGVTWETPGGAGNPTADKTLEMIGRLAAGATAEEVAAEFGVSRGRASAVRARAVRAGIVKTGRQGKAE
jgi:uncharacterized protein (DUF433 family)